VTNPLAGRWQARLKCQRCGHEWIAPAGPEEGSCPACGYLYVTWLNYDELIRKKRA